MLNYQYSYSSYIRYYVCFYRQRPFCDYLCYALYKSSHYMRLRLILRDLFLCSNSKSNTTFCHRSHTFNQRAVNQIDEYYLLNSAVVVFKKITGALEFAECLRLYTTTFADLAEPGSVFSPSPSPEKSPLQACLPCVLH